MTDHNYISKALDRINGKLDQILLKMEVIADAVREEIREDIEKG